MKVKEEHKKGFTFIKTVLGPIFKFYYRPKCINTEYIPKDGPVIIAGNHKHLFDQCLTIASTDRMIHYMAKKEYFDNKKVAWFFKLAGCIPVNRQIKDTESKNKAIDLLKKGFCVGIFPEGTRNKTDAIMLPLKHGTVSMAQKSDAYIVPFAITGDYVFRSKNLKVTFGKPFKVTDMDLDKANDKLTKEILKLLKQNK